MQLFGRKKLCIQAFFFIIAKYICIKDPIAEVSFVGMMQN